MVGTANHAKDSEDGNTGAASFDAYSGGPYGTWLAQSGFYGDALLEVTRFVDSEAHSSGG